MSEQDDYSGKGYFVDDRGNVAQFYFDGDKIATLDREAEVDGKQDETTWDGGEDVTEWANENGYKEEIEEATKI